jgi:hypothetical protein
MVFGYAGMNEGQLLTYRLALILGLLMTLLSMSGALVAAMPSDQVLDGH